MNDYIASVQNMNQIEAFRGRMRTVDVLLIDDIHFLAGKEGSQEEFFHTFNTLHNASKQIILCSDAPPKDIPTLEERLLTRFSWGMVARIDTPTFETRVAILKRKAEARGTPFPEDVYFFIAQNIESNIRELEGAVVKTAAYASLLNRAIDLDLAREALRDSLEVARDFVQVTDVRRWSVENWGKTAELQSAVQNPSALSDRGLPRAHHDQRFATDIGNAFGGRTIRRFCTDHGEGADGYGLPFRSFIEQLADEIRKAS